MSSIVNHEAHPNAAMVIDHMLRGGLTSISLEAAIKELGRVLNPEALTDEIQHLLALPSSLHHGHGRFSIKAGNRLRHLELMHHHDGEKPQATFKLNRIKQPPKPESFRISQTIMRELSHLSRRNGLLVVSAEEGIAAALAEPLSSADKPAAVISRYQYRTSGNIESLKPSSVFDNDHVISQASLYRSVFIDQCLSTTKQIEQLIELASRSFVLVNFGSGHKTADILRRVASLAGPTNSYSIIGALEVNAGDSSLQMWNPEYQESLEMNLEPGYRDSLSAVVV